MASVNDLLAAIPSAGAWFRAQSASDWPLAPGVLRSQFKRRAHELFPADGDPVRVLEVEQNRLFRSNAAALLPTARSDVDVYIIAQHHGLPTRLLDWSRDPLAAMFFALHDEAHLGHDGSFFILDPSYAVLPGDDHGVPRARRFMSSDAILAEHVGVLFDTGLQVNREVLAPIPFIPDRLDARVSQQGSLFTFHSAGAEDLPAGYLKQLRVPAAAKLQFREDLRRLGLAWDLLFPDLDHVVREIRYEYGLEPEEWETQPRSQRWND